MQRVLKGTIVLTAAILAASSLPAQGRKVAAPVGVAITSNTAALAVSWTNVANAVSYQVNRRERTVLTTHGTVQGSPYSGPLPPAGTPYEYQVVSIGGGRNNSAPSAWVPYTVPVSMPTTTTPGVIVTEPRPSTGGTITPTIVPPGPTSATAGSTIPGQIIVSWTDVAGATRYRIVRSSNAPEPEATVTEQANSNFWSEGGLFNWTNAPVDLRWTYTYKIFALLPNPTGGYTVSTASPAATARSVAVVQPSGLRYAVALTSLPGRVNVTLSWSAVPNAAKYVITGTDAIGMSSIVVTGTSQVLSNVPASNTYRVCVGAVFPYDIGDPSTAPCIDVRLQ
jgi:hypothetical protein